MMLHTICIILCLSGYLQTQGSWRNPSTHNIRATNKTTTTAHRFPRIHSPHGFNNDDDSSATPDSATTHNSTTIHGTPTSHVPPAIHRFLASHGSFTSKKSPSTHCSPAPNNSFTIHSFAMSRGSPITHASQSTHGKTAAGGSPMIPDSSAAHITPVSQARAVAQGSTICEGTGKTHGSPMTEISHIISTTHNGLATQANLANHRTPPAHSIPANHASLTTHRIPVDHSIPMTCEATEQDIWTSPQSMIMKSLFTDLKVMAVMAGLLVASQYKIPMLPTAVLSMSLLSTVHAPAPCSMVEDLTPPRSTGYTEKVTAERFWRFEILETDYCWRVGQDFRIFVTENLPRSWQRTFKGFVIQVRSPFYLGHKLVGLFDLVGPPERDWTYDYVFHCGMNGSATHKDDQPKRHVTLFWYADQGHRYNYVLISGVVLIDGRRWMKLREEQVSVCPPRPPRAYITPSKNKTTSSDFNTTMVPTSPYPIPTTTNPPLPPCENLVSANGILSRHESIMYYSTLQEADTFQVAKKRCAATNGSILATIKYQEEYDHIIKLTRRRNIWLGFNGAAHENNLSITWFDGDYVNDAVTRMSNKIKWGDLEPNQCGALTTIATEVSTTRCYDFNRYICQLQCPKPKEVKCPEGYSSQLFSRQGYFMCYTDLQTKASNEEARIQCAKNGSMIVTIKNAQEYEHLLTSAVTAKAKGIWLGFKGAANKSAITWSDGGYVDDSVTSMGSKIYWGTIQPYQCGVLRIEVDSFMTMRCTDDTTFFCQLQCPIEGLCLTPPIANTAATPNRTVSNSSQMLTNTGSNVTLSSLDL